VGGVPLHILSPTYVHLLLCCTSYHTPSTRPRSRSVAWAWASTDHVARPWHPIGTHGHVTSMRAPPTDGVHLAVRARFPVPPGLNVPKTHLELRVACLWPLAFVHRSRSDIPAAVDAKTAPCCPSACPGCCTVACSQPYSRLPASGSSSPAPPTRSRTVSTVTIHPPALCLQLSPASQPRESLADSSQSGNGSLGGQTCAGAGVWRR
jgi:hypothetical protein